MRQSYLYKWNRVLAIKTASLYWNDPLTPCGNARFMDVRFSKRQLSSVQGTWAPSQYKDCLSRCGIHMLKIRRSWDRLIFNMRIPIPRKTVSLYRDAPRPDNDVCDCEYKISKRITLQRKWEFNYMQTLVYFGYVVIDVTIWTCNRLTYLTPTPSDPYIYHVNMLLYK